MKIENPYHDGEIRVQELAGERDIALLTGGGVQDRIVAPAARFLAQLRFIVLGRADDEHRIEGTVLFGAPGFLRAEEEGTVLSIALAPGRSRSTDPVLDVLSEGQRIGALAIDLQTRRRLRINGRVVRIEPERLAVQVRESYANCPKYIQKRVVEIDDSAPNAEAAITGSAFVASGVELGEEQRRIISTADTLFVATVNPRGDADASHRGGEPGFVRIQRDGPLAIPDYAGNSMFNTLGNVAANPNAALLFWDFERGLLLHLAGRASIHFGEDSNGLQTGQTGRFWRFSTEHWREQAVPIPFRMRLVERSPFNPQSK